MDAGLFVVIGLAAQDGHGTIKLLNEEEAHHLMAESQTRQRNFLAATLINCGRKAIGTADYEDQPSGSGGTTTVDITRELYRTELLTALIKEHQPIAFGQTTQDEFALALFLLLETQRFGIAQLGNDLDAEGDIVAQTGGIVCNQRLQSPICGLTDNNK